MPATEKRRRRKTFDLLWSGWRFPRPRRAPVVRATDIYRFNAADLAADTEIGGQEGEGEDFFSPVFTIKSPRRAYISPAYEE